MDRNGVDINKKTMGIQRKLSTKIIPCIEKMLSRGPPVIGATNELRIPALGPSNMIQPTTLMIPGMAKET